MPPPRCLGAGTWQPKPRAGTSSTTSTTTWSRAFACPAILSRYSWIGTYDERAVECCGPDDAEREAPLRTMRFAACDDDAGEDAHRSRRGGDAPISVRDVVRALRGKTVAFVGDSTMHQLWTALVAELFAAGIPLDVTQRVLEFNIGRDNHNRDDMCTVSHTNPPRGGGCENTFRLDARMRPHRCNLTDHKGAPAFNLATNPWPLRPQCESLPDLELALPSEEVVQEAQLAGGGGGVPAPHAPHGGVRFLFYRMDWNRSKTVRAGWQKTHGHCGSAYKNFNAKLDAAAGAADVILANVGVWYGHAMEKAYRSDVDYIIARLLRFSGGGGRGGGGGGGDTRKLGLFRESIVQHFPTRSGSGLYEEWVTPGSRGAGRHKGGGGALGGRLGRLKGTASCPSRCPDLGADYADRLDWRNRVLHEQAASRGFPPEHIVPVASLLRPMGALHKRTKWACSLDCTHYCYHPDLWAALLDGVYRRILNWADDAGATSRVAAGRAGGGGADGAATRGRASRSGGGGGGGGKAKGGGGRAGGSGRRKARAPGGGGE